MSQFLCIRWPKYWSFSFSISLSNEYSGLISFRIDWFDPLAFQGTLKSLLQHHSAKASVLILNPPPTSIPIPLWQIHVRQVSDASQPSHPLSTLFLLPPIPPSIRVFSNELTLCMRWPKYWSFSFSISPSNEHPGPISFRIDWLDLPAVQGILKSLLQHHSSKASILWHSTLFMVQFSHPYMTIGKTIALTRQTFVGKVML